VVHLILKQIYLILGVGGGLDISENISKYCYFKKVVKNGENWQNMKKPTFKARFTVQNTPFWANPDIPLGTRGLVDFNNIFM